SKMVTRYSWREVTRPSSSKSLIRGWTSSCMKVRTRARISSCSGARVKSIAMALPRGLVEADHVAVLVDVDPLGRRAAGQSGHGPHVPAHEIDEPGADIGPGLAHG